MLIVDLYTSEHMVHVVASSIVATEYIHMEGASRSVDYFPRFLSPIYSSLEEYIEACDVAV